MSFLDRFLKRSLDLVISVPSLVLLAPLIVVAWMLAARDTGASGLFRQQRVGRGGKPFTICKIRTMRVNDGPSVTTGSDARITPLGRKLRKYKIDELPQLWNIVTGDMSLVGPRPDVPGYADRLTGEARGLLALRPGITGPATLKYRNEEDMLAGVEDAVKFNDEVIWPDKVRINLAYMNSYSVLRDIRYLLATAGLAENRIPD